jgi:Cytochrome c/c1 heme lyase.
MGQTTSKHDTSMAPVSAPPPGCPIHNEKPASGCPVPHEPAANLPQCPVDHTSLNPLNQMPSLAQEPSPNQSVLLPTVPTESSIPRDPSSKWEYPSPQQFYNALVRKGWETPEDSVETMVEIHNFLNEQAWAEVLKWEQRQNW